MATIPIGSGGSVTQQLTVLVHEVGHNLFLDHNFNGNSLEKNSCVHSGVMNYRYSTAIMGWGSGGLGYRRFSYSNGTCAASETTTPAGYTCPNTCNTSHCVPSSEESPKLGCHPNSGSCDCDRDEWNMVDLRFTIVPTSGEALDLAHATLGDTQYDWLNSYFMGSGELTADQLAHVAAKEAFLTSQGKLPGVDYTVSPATRHFNAVEPEPTDLPEPPDLPECHLDPPDDTSQWYCETP